MAQNAQHNRRPSRGQHLGDPVLSANNTAQHFLGGARHAWMPQTSQTFNAQTPPSGSLTHHGLAPKPQNIPAKRPLERAGHIQAADSLPSPADSHEGAVDSPESVLGDPAFMAAHILLNASRPPSRPGMFGQSQLPPTPILLSTPEQAAYPSPQPLADHGIPQPMSRPTTAQGVHSQFSQPGLLQTGPAQQSQMVVPGTPVPATGLGIISPQAHAMMNYIQPVPNPPVVASQGTTPLAQQAPTPVMPRPIAPQRYAPSQPTSVLSSPGLLNPIGAFYDINQAIKYVNTFFETRKDAQTQALGPLRHAIEYALRVVDPFFLLLLQLTCITVLNPDAAPPPPFTADLLKSTVRRVALLLSNRNDSPGRDFCYHFAGFPSKLAVTMQGFHTQQVEYFLQRLPSSMQAVVDVSTGRGYPYLPSEYFRDMHIPSPIFQGLCHNYFTSRCFHITTPNMRHQMQFIFNEAQNLFFTNLGQSGGTMIDPPQSYRDYYEQQTRPLCRDAMARHLAQGAATASLTSSGPQAQTQQAQMQQAQMQQASDAQQGPPQQLQQRQSMAQNPMPQGQNTPGPLQQVPQAYRAPGQASIPQTIAQGMRPMQQHGPVQVVTGMQQPSPQLPQHSHQRAPAPALLFNRIGGPITYSSTRAPETYGLFDLHLSEKVMKVHPVSANAGPFYQAIFDTFLPFTEFTTDQPIFDRTFNIAADVIASRPQTQFPLDIKPRESQPAQWLVKSTTSMFRLRCIKPDRNDHKLQSNFTIWPQHTYFSCNGEELQPRRKLQWHKDLPIDLTEALKPGLNTIRIFNNKRKVQQAEEYAFVVERILLMSAKDIVSRALSNVNSPEQFIRSLPANASTTNNDDGDDLVVISDTITVSILDPMSASFISTPAKGRSCTHYQPFDLHNFLQSRVKRPGSDVYELEWSCPICKAYAGPDVLYVEGFFVQVKETLEAMQRTDARSIIINRNGTWIIKEEKEEKGESGDGGSGDNGRDGRGRAVTTASGARRSESVINMTVIELD